DKTTDGVHGSDPSGAAARQRLAPPGLLGRNVQNVSQTRSATEKLPAEFVRILAGGGREFVRERFGNEAADRSSRRAPKTDGNAGVVIDVLGAPVRDAVGEARYAANRYGIDALETFQCLRVEAGK